MLELGAVTSALAAYRAVAVAATKVTDPRVTARLAELGARIVPGGQAGESRRAALAASPFADCDCFSCDFDRWLHWATFWPDELAALPERVTGVRSQESGAGEQTPDVQRSDSRLTTHHSRLSARLLDSSTSRLRPWYVCLGRTARAFRTHPAAQRQPEAATNRAISLAAGRSLDAVAGAAWLSPDAAAIILAESREATAATDLEWPALILRSDPALLRGLRCEGLEWETPDFHAAEIAAAGGLAAWARANYDTPATWASRLRLAAASTAALERVLERSREVEKSRSG